MTEIFTTDAGIELILVHAGKFIMGGDKNFIEMDEQPGHKVKIKKDFYLGKYPVTQAQWAKVMGENPSEYKGDERPVEMISWDDAQLFINKINEIEKTDKYRLPTEAEWEFAAKGGCDDSYYFGSNAKELNDYGWYRKNSNSETNPVGKLKPNDYGFYDILGNVYEWCLDWYDKEYYKKSPSKSPTGPKNGFGRVSRGGDWSSDEGRCRCGNRTLSSPDRRGNKLGFRLCRSV